MLGRYNRCAELTVYPTTILEYHMLVWNVKVFISHNFAIGLLQLILLSYYHIRSSSRR